MRDIHTNDCPVVQGSLGCKSTRSQELHAEQLQQITSEVMHALSAQETQEILLRFCTTHCHIPPLSAYTQPTDKHMDHHTVDIPSAVWL